MAEEGLIFVYTKAQYKVHKTEVNESKAGKKLDRELNGCDRLEVIASDLTDVRVGNQWSNISTIMDLYNREIIGYSIVLVIMKKLSTMRQYKVRPRSRWFTDRGKEFYKRKN